MIKDEKTREYIYILNEIFHIHYNYYIQEYKKIELITGITSSQGRILVKLKDHNEYSVSKLAEICLLHISTLYKILKGMEKKGFVLINNYEKDKRVKIVSITSQGEKKINEYMEQFWMNNPLEKNLKYIDKEKIFQIFQGLKILTQLKLGKEETKEIIKKIVPK